MCVSDRVLSEWEGIDVGVHVYVCVCVCASSHLYRSICESLTAEDAYICVCMFLYLRTNIYEHVLQYLCMYVRAIMYICV